MLCPSCGHQLSDQAKVCPHCGHPFAPDRSPLTAGCLAALLGPVGLWYKGHWAAGFAWLVLGALISAATYGIAIPFVWIGMIVHAAKAEPR